METVDRRAALGRLGIIALMPAFAGMPVLARATQRLAIPEGTYLLRRVLERELALGQSLTVVREWRCRFDPGTTGMVVNGEQSACEVVAPARLAPLAEMEKRREVTGFFPVTIDEQGLISGAGKGLGENIATAVAQATTLLGKAAGPDERAYVAAIGQASAQVVSELPIDLFFPVTGRREIVREIPLDGGESGSLRVIVNAVADPASGLLVSSEKTIVTQVGAHSRRAREAWEMART